MRIYIENFGMTIDFDVDILFEFPNKFSYLPDE